MSIKLTILFSLSIVFLIIGLHQTFLHGIAASYFLFMFSILFLLLFASRKKKEAEEASIQNENSVTKLSKSTLKSKKIKK